jgi:predicted extracellular nuclease
MQTSMHVRAPLLAALMLAVAGFAQAAVTAIPVIQGSGAASPLAGQRVTTQGVVTHLTNNGFFLQDAQGDGDPTTSDGIFVFTSSAPTVAVGQWLQLEGTVTEFDVSLGTSNPAAESRPLTELTSIANLVPLGTGTVVPTLVTLPSSVADDLERFEGMLVTLSGPKGEPLTVQQNFFQGRYGQLTVAAGGRRETPTNRFRPGTAEALALADENARSTLLLDDSTSAQNPDPTPYLDADGVARAGDTLAKLTGVIDFGLATNRSAGIVAYRLQPTVAPSFTASNPRPVTPPAVGGNLRLAAFNVLNYFTTFTNGNTADGQTGQTCTLGNETPSASLCRGASNATEFQRQRSKIIEALAAIDADAVGLMEIQNNGAVAAQNLADGLNARLGAGTYAVVPDPGNGTGTDAIKVAMLYKPARLALVGPALSDTAPVYSRPPLAQTFAAANGERFTVVVNHFKSKGCGDAAGADLDQGDGQGCYNATRLAQAQALRAFVVQVQATSGSSDVLVTGDLNAYGQEDPIADFTGNGYVDELLRFTPLAYSYVFDGAAGRLDHALATASLSAKLSSARTWAINADEASLRDYNQEFKAPRTCSGRACPPDPYAPDVFRSSDHDPVLVGLNIYKRVTGSAKRDLLSGSPGDDLIIGGIGADRLSGGDGGDLFAYQSMRDAGDVVTDFVPGEDRIDLRGLLAGSGYAGTNAVADGWVSFRPKLGGTAVFVDPDGPAGPATLRALLTLRSLTPAQLDGARDLLVR